MDRSRTPDGVRRSYLNPLPSHILCFGFWDFADVDFENLMWILHF